MRFRSLLLAAAAAASLALGACTDEELASTKHLKPIPSATMMLMDKKGLKPQDPILIRIFKDESKFEVWKKSGATGRFVFLKDYEICRWSGKLGPKVAKGDKQSPEGFYTITPGQMNPNSSYYLSFNIGFPNAYDRAWGRTGEFLMVHGACSSAGCYSMTDEQVAEIYALGREAFKGGQRSFQIQAYPFRMTPEKLALYRENPNMPFWKNLKQGYDAFEVTKLEPKVDVCEKRYVFNATSNGGAFVPTAACPSFEVPEAIAREVAAKEKRDEAEIAALVAKGASTAPADLTQKDVAYAKLRFNEAPEVKPALEAEPVVAKTEGPAAVTANAMAATDEAKAAGTAAAETRPKSGKSSMFGWLRGGESAAGTDASASADAAAADAGTAKAEGAAVATTGSATPRAMSSAGAPVPLPSPEPGAAAAVTADPAPAKPFYRRMIDWLPGGTAKAPAKAGDPTAALPAIITGGDRSIPRVASAFAAFE